MQQNQSPHDVSNRSGFLLTKDNSWMLSRLTGKTQKVGVMRDYYALLRANIGKLNLVRLSQHRNLCGGGYINALLP